MGVVLPGGIWFTWWDWGQEETRVSIKTVTEDLDQNLHNILKTFYGFEEKEHTRQDISQFLLQNVQYEIFEILKMFKNKITFSRGAYWIDSKISSRDNTTFMILLFSPLLVIILPWNSTSSSCLKLTVQIQLALCPCNPFLINNHNVTGNNAEKHCYVVFNVKLQVKLRFKTFYWLLKLL